jgi:hypothetical protein
MSRTEDRKTKRDLERIVRKAKEDMMKWMLEAGYEPNSQEAAAWKEGYIAGVNRASNN